MLQYAVTLTPSGGGTPITSTSTTPAVAFQGLTPGTQASLAGWRSLVSHLGFACGHVSKRTTLHQAAG